MPTGPPVNPSSSPQVQSRDNPAQAGGGRGSATPDPPDEGPGRNSSGEQQLLASSGQHNPRGQHSRGNVHVDAHTTLPIAGGGIPAPGLAGPQTNPGAPDNGLPFRNAVAPVLQTNNQPRSQRQRRQLTAKNLQKRKKPKGIKKRTKAYIKISSLNMRGRFHRGEDKWLSPADVDDVHNLFSKRLQVFATIDPTSPQSKGVAIVVWESAPSYHSLAWGPETDNSSSIRAKQFNGKRSIPIQNGREDPRPNAAPQRPKFCNG